MTSMTPKTQVGVWGEVPPAEFVLEINGILARPWAPFPIKDLDGRCASLAA